jgi:hypothetical protein
VYALDAALPLPVILAGPPSRDWQFTDPSTLAFGGGFIPVRVAGTASVLPAVGPAGVMVDLDSSRRIAADSDLAGEFEVWLAPGAPGAILDALAANGLTVTADESAPARAARLGEQGPAVVSRFALVAGIISLLLAAATVAVAAAVDRGAQLDQLQAIRLQGLSARTARGIGWAGPAVLIAAGLLGGLLAAAIARPLARVAITPFTDSWQVIAPPGALGAATLALAGLVALVVLGLVGWLSVLPLLRRLRGGER